MQFGRLKLQTVLSQKKSSTKSVSTKGGTQTTPFELDVADYEENRHFFLSHYFRQHYDQAMSNLPNLLTGIEINPSGPSLVSLYLVIVPMMNTVP